MKAVEKLLDVGADVNVKAIRSTALNAAKERGHFNIV